MTEAGIISALACSRREWPVAKHVITDLCVRRYIYIYMYINIHMAANICAGFIFSTYTYVPVCSTLYTLCNRRTSYLQFIYSIVCVCVCSAAPSEAPSSAGETLGCC